MGTVMHYVKIVGGGFLAVGLVIGVIVLGVEVARLSSELEDLQNNTTTTPAPETTTEDPSTLDPWDRDYRLPAELVPETYDLFLFPVLSKGEDEPGNFTGNVTLRFQLTQAQEYIPVHVKSLSIGNVILRQLTSGANQIVEIGRRFDAPRNEFYVLLPKGNTFSRGLYELFMEFGGSLMKPDIVGMYESNYTNPSDPNAEVKKLVTSKFEPTYARRAFPCFDEPDRKANFTVSLVRPAGGTWSALSNMNVVIEELIPDTDYKIVKFATSVKMSTYLACFIVSEFTFNAETIDNNGDILPLKVYAPEHLVANTDFARDAAKNITEYYIGYFGIKYQLPKLDLIAIPDFVSGAMEHWGLITFRETNLIVDPDKSSAANQQQVGQVVAHELAHMWFGNLVTMKWWDDLWLNEGFASFTEYKGLNKSRPDMGVLDQFLIQDLQPVMALDAQLSSHPVIQHVEHPDQITELFDTITYSKGSAVLRMLEDLLGEEVFKKGVNKYLTDFMFKNAETRDLWRALQWAVDENNPDSLNVTRLMDTWTLQMGLPVINVVYDENKNLATLTQTRFFATPQAAKAAKQQTQSEFNYKWDVPITYFSREDNKPKQRMFHLDEDKITIDINPPSSWIKLNAKQMGFYRVNYEAEMWEKLIVAYSFIKEPTDRSSLLDDVFSLADASLVSYDKALEFGDMLKQETEYVPWSTAASRLQQILTLMRGKLSYEKYRSYLIGAVQDTYNDLKWDPTGNHTRKRLQATILNHACAAGMSDCLAEAGTQFKDWLEDPTKVILPDLRQIAYKYGMEEIGNIDVWNQVYGIYKTETDAQERSKLLISLASIKEPWILEMFIALAESEENVRGQDYFTVLQNISDNPVGTSIVWDFVRANWEKLVDRFTLNNRYLGRMIPHITQTFSTELKLEEMKAFFAKYPEAGAGEASRAQALERVEGNIQWVAIHVPVIEAWLNKNIPS